MRVRIVVVVGLLGVALTSCTREPVPLTQVGVVAAGPVAAVPAAVRAPSVGGGVDPAWVQAHSRSDLPARAVQAYAGAELLLAASEPACHLSWTLLAGIGEVESANGTVGGSVLGPDGVSTPPIRGLPLDGTGDVAVVTDTDGGALDGLDTVDRAVGPLQLIPDTWTRWAADGDGDGVRDPDDLDDAAAAAGRYLCAAGGDLSTDVGWTTAVLAYNHSDEYVRQVHDASVRAAS